MTEGKGEHDGAADIDWSQYEAIVETRVEYYLPRFQRFGRGGRFSWNWGAFFGTLAWLRYRKLYAWSWLYFFVSTPFLLGTVIIVAAASDACQLALASHDYALAQRVVLGLAFLGWIAPPLLANRIYFQHVRALVDEASHAFAQGHNRGHEFGRRAGTGGVAGAIALQIFVLVVAAVAGPSYANYQYRVRVYEGVSLVGGLKTPLEEYVEQHGRLPAKIAEIASATSGKHVSTVVLEPDGTIRATFGKDAQELSDHSVSMVPTMKDGRIVEWICRSDDLPNVCLPASCRRQN